MRSPFKPTHQYTLPALLLLAALVALLLVMGQVQRAQAAPPRQDGDPVVVAAGDIAKCNLEWDTYTAALLDNIPGTILGIGDNAYVQGTLQEFNDCYGPTWGRHKDRVRPVPGNHEYLTGGAAGYFTYFGAAATPLEPDCRSECKGYYSFDLGDWHIVALNSEIDINSGSAQDLWLRADLAANPRVCTLAYWHKPRFSSGHHGSGASAPLFQAIYDYGVDVVLSGHDHDYERFAPQDPAGQYAPDRGVRQFVVGTGGDTHRSWESNEPNSEARNDETWGVLKLTLHAGSYDWEFIPIAGQTFTDSGSADCVTAGSVPAAPAASVIPISTSSAAVDVSGDSDETAAAPESAAALPAAGLDYVVAAGDTLSLIALRYGLDWQVVAQVNGLTNTEVIEIGQIIRLPNVNETTGATPVATTSAATAAATSTTAATSDAATTGAPYLVVAGDSLLGIALRANISLAELAAANTMQPDDLLLIGQQLTLPGRSTPLGAAGAAAAGAVTTGATVTATGGVTPSLSLTQVRPVTPTRPLTGSVTSARPLTVTGPVTSSVTGGPLLLPTPTPRPFVAAPAAAGSGPATHTVTEGDTMITIALQYNLDWEELLALNGMGPDSLLQIGQEIRLR